jgi:hypothetical protein
VADRTRRDTVLRASAVVNGLAILLTVYAILAPQHSVTLLGVLTDNKFLLLCGAMALWGAAYGSWPIVDSLFADSVPTGMPGGIPYADLAPCANVYDLPCPFAAG